VLLRPKVHEWRFARRVGAMHQKEAGFHAGLAKTVTVASEGFSPGGEIPAVSTCRGPELSPAVAWGGVPADTRSLVLMMVDWDAPSWKSPSSGAVPWSGTHWLLYNIAPPQASIGAGTSNADLKARGIDIGDNELGKPGYFGPCARDGAHHYLIRVYALDVARIQPSAPNREGVAEAINGHILSYGELAGTAGG
jgi:Raf kinase inhibitor-like YbhB/YbcL family protein